VPPRSRISGPSSRSTEPEQVIDLSADADLAVVPDDGAEPSIEISWSKDGGCTVELRGRPTRLMLAEARDILWSRSAQDRLTVVVTDAVLTRNLFALLIAGRRRLSAAGVFEIVGLNATGARHIANSRPAHRENGS
jgi:hypothetical protein